MKKTTIFLFLAVMLVIASCKKETPPPEDPVTGGATLTTASASQFSLIPPSNASGNFTKVTQRVSIKISIDSTEKGNKLETYNLMTGMSAVVKIIK
ncbi:MAG: hypothetical protein WCO84_06140 [bacterium]